MGERLGQKNRRIGRMLRRNVYVEKKMRCSEKGGDEKKILRYHTIKYLNLNKKKNVNKLLSPDPDAANALLY
jgi:hypothetical protein